MREEFGLFNAKDILQRKVSRNFMIDQIIYEREMMCLSAEKKSGKSIIMQQMAFNLSTGTPFLNHFDVTRKYTVLYIQAEGFLDDSIFRYKCMNRAIQPSENLWLWNIRGLGLHDPKSIKEIRACCDKVLESSKTGSLDVIIFDPLYKVMCGGDLNEQRYCIEAGNNIDKLMGIYNCTALFAHHESEKFTWTKDGKQRNHSSRKGLLGSSFWSAYFSQIYKLYERSGVHYLNATVSRMGVEDESLQLRLVKPQEDDNERLLFELDHSSNSASLFSIQQCLEDGNELSTTQIVKQANTTRQTLHAVVKKHPDIFLVRKVGNKNFYSLKTRPE